MLILTRKPGESIYIGDNIKVTLVELKGNQARIGVAAPADTRIYREEIFLQILDENKKAAEGVSDTSLDQLSGGWKGGLKGGEKFSERPVSGGAMVPQAANPSKFLRRKSLGSERGLNKGGSPDTGGEKES